jgi:hypothetical protein
MKQIVNAVSTVEFKNITNKSFVGIDWGCNHKAIVIEKEKDKFVSLSNCGYSNLLDCWSSTTIKDYVFRATGQGPHVKAYEFDNIKELLAWLALEEK